MSFSPEWDAEYARGGHRVRSMEQAVWMLFQHFIGENLEGQRVLEFGAAVGANVGTLLKVKAEYYGIEASKIAVDELIERFPELSERIWHGDFTEPHPFGGGFDVVLDRASITHNGLAGIKRAVQIAYDSLKPGGIFLGSDWFSTAHSECDPERGRRLEQSTYTGYKDGQFAGVGTVHFSSEKYLAALFSKFEPISIHERITRRPMPGKFLPNTFDPRWISEAFAVEEYRSAVWDFACRRPL